MRERGIQIPRPPNVFVFALFPSLSFLYFFFRVRYCKPCKNARTTTTNVRIFHFYIFVNNEERVSFNFRLKLEDLKASKSPGPCN